MYDSSLISMVNLQMAFPTVQMLDSVSRGVVYFKGLLFFILNARSLNVVIEFLLEVKFVIIIPA